MPILTYPFLSPPFTNGWTSKDSDELLEQPLKPPYPPTLLAYYLYVPGGENGAYGMMPAAVAAVPRLDLVADCTTAKRFRTIFAGVTAADLARRLFSPGVDGIGIAGWPMPSSFLDEVDYHAKHHADLLLSANKPEQESPRDLGSCVLDPFLDASIVACIAIWACVRNKIREPPYACESLRAVVLLLLLLDDER